jgi:hypothetical protein
MNCKKEWTMEFFIDKFPKNFVFKEYAQKRKNLMLEREMIYIKDSQQLFIEKKKEKEINDQINDFYQKIRDHKKMIKQLSLNINNLYEQLNNVQKENKINMNHHIKCISENCLGYLIQYKCPLCEIKICSKCHCLLDNENHECNPDIVKNISMIKTECKNCPQCYVPIYKIEGCDQMWCTQCKIIFSWKTGEQIKNTSWIHNPHYLEYLRRGGNEVEEEKINQCENEFRLPNYKTISKYIREYDKRDTIYSVYAQTAHIYDIILRQYRGNIIEHDFNSFLKERLQFMNHEIDKSQFQDILIKKIKASDKFKEFSQIIYSFVMIIIEIFKKIIYNNKIIKNDDYFNEFKEIINEYYDLFEKVLKKHNSSYVNPLSYLKQEFFIIN